MKRDHRHAVLVALGLAFAVAGAATAACGPPPRRNDWRHPPPRTCASDAECQGGTCAIELGASRGTCSGGSLPALPPAPSVDGGTKHPPGPGPSIQPSSSDIQI